MKKLVSFLTALVMLVSALCATDFSAFAQDTVYSGIQENPFYAGREIPDGSLEEVKLYTSVSRTYNNKTYYSAGKEIYKKILTALQNRTDEIAFYYLTKTSINDRNIISEMDSLIASATDDEFNSSCTGGDYQRWSMHYFSASSQEMNYNSPYHYYRIELGFDYYDTAAQEKQVDAVVNTFVNSIDTNSMTDYEILKTVHNFICEGTTYSNAALDDYTKHMYAFTAYGALIKGSCVCQGYALAFYRLCKELGYSTRIITSSYLDLSTLSYTGHAWNLVGLNGKYYYVDTTWDDSEDEEDYTFFLVNGKAIRYYDSADEHFPEEKYYDGGYYTTTYADKIDEKNYDSTNSSLLSNCVVSISPDRYTYSGERFMPEAVVTKKDGTELGESDFSVSYSGGTNTGLATVNVTGAGEYEGSSSHRQYYIAPSKANKLSLASGGRGPTSLSLKWTASDGAVTGYKIEHYSGGKWSVVATVTGASNTSVKITNLTPAASHKFRMRAYKAVSKRNLYGGYSAVFTSCTKPNTPALTLKTAKNSITLSWKKLSCTGYEIQLSQSSKFNSKVRKFTVKQGVTSKKISKLKKGTKYYVRIRAYKVIGGTKYYSGWRVKSIKCK